MCQPFIHRLSCWRNTHKRTDCCWAGYILLLPYLYGCTHVCLILMCLIESLRNHPVLVAISLLSCSAITKTNYKASLLLNAILPQTTNCTAFVCFAPYLDSNWNCDSIRSACTEDSVRKSEEKRRIDMEGRSRVNNFTCTLQSFPFGRKYMNFVAHSKVSSNAIYELTPCNSSQECLIAILFFLFFA